MPIVLTVFRKYHRRFFESGSTGYTLLLLLIVVLSRLPAILNEQLILDGDECIVGLMAKWMSENQFFFPYFLGQTYGFALIETIPLSVLFKIAGINDVYQKLVGAILFALAAVFLFKGFREVLRNNFSAFLFALAFVFAPSWQQWSIKITGGYLSALLVCSIIFYLTVSPQRSAQKKSMVLALLLVMLFESQRLWIPLACLLSLNWLLKQSNKSKILISGFCVAFAVELIFYWIKSGIVPFWQPQPIALSVELLARNAPRLIEFITASFTGTFYYADNFHRGLFTESIAGIYTWLALAAPINVLFFRKNSQSVLLSYLSLAAMIISILSTLFFVGFVGRYLLALQVSLLIFYASAYHYLFQFSSVKLILSVLIGICVYSYFETSKLPYEWHSKKQVTELCETLIKNNKQAVYCSNGLLQWQIDYYSKEKLRARYFQKYDRFQYHQRFVDSIRVTQPAKCVALGFIYNLPEKYKSIADTRISPYYIIWQPGDSLLKNLGYEL